MYFLLKLSLVSMLFFSCSQEERISESNINEVIATNIAGVSPLELSISIPQNSGLAFVNYERYTIKNDSLFVIDRKFRLSLDDSTSNYISDTTATYKLNPYKRIELKSILAGIDSLGHHSARGCHIQMGRVRFFISAKTESKEMDGFIANCYRERRRKGNS